MTRLLPGIAVPVLLLAATALAAPRSSVLYLDGVRHTVEAAAVKGVCEVAIPAGAAPGSVRVRPVGEARIARVAVVAARPEPGTVRETERLDARKEQLQARLQALAAREEVFRAAARSQSGKAPRKTKSNPEPLAAIRQGTEYAITQLEEVYRLRRRAEKELATVDTRLAALRAGGSAAGSVVRVWLETARGAAAVSWTDDKAGWTPRYDLRFDGRGTVRASLRAGLPSGTAGAVAVVPAAMAAGGVPRPVAADGAEVTSCVLPTAHEQAATVPYTTLRAVVTNTTGQSLPAGTADGYWQGEYLGTAPFPLLAPGMSTELQFGAASVATP